MAQDESEPSRVSLVRWWRRITGGVDTAGGAKAPERASGIEAMPQLAGPEPGRFEERGTVARGGMGRIDRVYDTHMRREVVMKRLEDAGDGRRIELLDEAQVTGQLGHPNVVPIHDIFADADGRPAAFLMKLVEGRTFEALIREVPADGGVDQRRLESLLSIFLKVCDAVAFAHSRGVIHRDLKPENVMVGSFGQVYLMDWGLAKLMKRGPEPQATPRVRTSYPRHEQRGQTYGTPAYMSIEQAFGDVDSIDERTDVYGLGGILYEILTQRPPHESAASVIKGQPTHPQEVVGDRPLPARLCAITMKALEASQEDRYQSVAALRDEVDAFVRSGGWFPQRRFAAGEAIVREGEQGRTAYLIEQGTCEVWRGSGARRERVRELGPGEPFGEAALFADTPRTATVTALTDVTLTVIDRESLDRELERHAWLRSLVSAMGVRFFEVDRELKNRRRSGDEP